MPAMKLGLLLVISLFHFGHSLQTCSSTISTTECQITSFTLNQPFILNTYKSLVQIKGKIATIPSGIFRNLPEVNTLYLSFDSITQLEPGSFLGLTKLNKLILNHNNIEQINEGVFRDCNNLNYLDLGANKIQSIGRDAFKELGNLEEIILSFNQLESIPDSIDFLAKLKKLDLSTNKIVVLNSDSFFKLRALKVLNLESNKLKYIRYNAFNGLVKLEDINLKDNYLANFNSTNVINNLPKLRTVKLSINDFTCTTLRTIIRDLDSRSIKVAQGVSRSNRTVNGIACK